MKSAFKLPCISGIHILFICLLSSCQSNPSDDSSINKIYKEAGLPRSIQPAQKTSTLASKSKPNPSRSTPTKKSSLQKMKPWNNSQPVTPEEGKRLSAVRELGWECYLAAKEGEDPEVNWIKAAKSFLEASRIPEKVWRSECLYNAACSYALAGHKKNALICLALTLRFGFNDFDHIKSDPDFDALRQEEKYRLLIKKYSGSNEEIPNEPTQGLQEKVKEEKEPSSVSGLTDIQSARKFYALATNFYNQKKFVQAAEMYLKAAPYLEKESKNAFYDAACSWSLAGEPEKAVKSLKNALKAGWTDINYLKNDPDLKILSSNTDFKKILNSAP